MMFAAYLAFLYACAPEGQSAKDVTPETDEETQAEASSEEEAMPQPESRSVREVPRPRIHARHILIAHSLAKGADEALDRTQEQAKAIAEQLLLQIKSGSDFAQLAREHSDDASAKRGGDLGVFTKGIMHKTFEETIGLEIGQHSMSLKPLGYHIIERMLVVEVHLEHILVQWVDLKRTARKKPGAVLIAEQALANSMQANHSLLWPKSSPMDLLVAAAGTWDGSKKGRWFPSLMKLPSL